MFQENMTEEEMKEYHAMTPEQQLAFAERRVTEKKSWEEKLEAFEKIMKALNHMGNEKEVTEALVHTLQTTHRTLQANFWRMVKEAAVEYAEFRYDDRNEAAVELTKEISKINVHIPFI